MPLPTARRFCQALLTAALLVRISAVFSPSLLPHLSIPAAIFLRKGIAIAHQVKVSEDVGGTLHIEPNDTPRAGEEVLAWVALTRAGGAPLSLNDCDCRMEIYAQPKQPGDSPLLSPPPMAVEGKAYPVLPGAQFTFPEVGAYSVVMKGQPRDTVADGQTPNTFTPFELAFNVTVAAGKANRNAATQAVDSAAAETPEDTANNSLTNTAKGAEKVPEKSPRGVAIVALTTGVLAGIISVLLWRSRQKS